MTEPTNPAPEFPKERSSAHGTEEGWTVEARSTVGPVNCGSQLFGSEWASVDFTPGTPGVPAGHPIYECHRFGMTRYYAAQALRYWFLAELDARFKGTGIETRLVKHTIEFSRKATAVSAIPCDPNEWRKS